MINSNKRNGLVDKIIQWSSNTSAHGFKNLFTSDRLIRKIFWFFILVFCISYCIYQIVLIITHFLEFKVLTSLKVVYEAPTDFPAVVICNLNAYDGDVAREEMENILFEKNISKYNYEPIDYVDNAADYFKSTFQAKALKGQFDLYFNGFYLSQMLISCQFQGKKCFERDFENYHDYQYGNCYRFNGNKKNVLKAKKTGWRNGLRLELYIGDLDSQQQFTYKAGMRVLIHNQSNFAFSDEDGVDIKVGSQTNIEITRTFIKRRPYPYIYCIEDHRSDKTLKANSFFQIIHKKYPEMRVYNQDYCLKICLQESLIRKCKCFDLKLPRPDNSSENASGCETVEELKCIQSEENNFYDGTEIEVCYKNCPNECTQVLYHTQISSAKYPSKWYASILNDSYGYLLDNKTFTDLQQTILMLNVFFNQMNYNVIEELPELSVDALFAYVGGNLGLFLGISVMSVIQIFELLFSLIFIFISRLGNLYPKKIQAIH